MKRLSECHVYCSESKQLLCVFAFQMLVSVFKSIILFKLRGQSPYMFLLCCASLVTIKCSMVI